jgi:hypothetical protein
MFYKLLYIFVANFSIVIEETLFFFVILFCCYLLPPRFITVRKIFSGNFLEKRNRKPSSARVYLAVYFNLSINALVF